jgi:four helix bundle protein
VEKENRLAKSFRDLEVYKLSFTIAMEIYEISKRFPMEEKYSLTDQIRRSSRSVCANIAEGWRKRKYVAMFISKLSDSAQEAAETQVWLEFALACKYIEKDIFNRLNEQYEHIFAMLSTMGSKAPSFCNTNPSRH